MNYLEKDRVITLFSNFQTPARAKYFLEISWLDDLEKLYETVCWAKSQNIPTLFVSGGTNMLFAFEEYQGVVIKNSLLWWNYDLDTKVLETWSAESIWEIADKLETGYWQNLWHRFIGLPGSIAGAVYWNAWCFGLETENNFVSCRVLDLESGEIIELCKNEMNFSYRNSRLKSEKKHFIISASFDLSRKIEKYHSDVDNIDFRENKQPKWMCCGSFFKNPSKDQSAWSLIEQVWLKGYHIWGAYFSEKHANFLMHDGTWKYTDLLKLIEEALIRTKNNFGVLLENEVQIIYNPPKQWQK